VDFKWLRQTRKEATPMTYAGAENATPDNVRRYLAENYSHRDERVLSEQDLDTLLATHDDIVSDGVRAGSFASYVGGKIADAAELTYTGDEADDD
jgi:hypothetical protein